MAKKKRIVNDFENSSLIYFSEIAKESSLSYGEEYELWEKYKKDGDINSRNKLITANLKFVANIARKYQGLGLSYSDLISEGNAGLVRAIDKFDASKGYKAITYSVWWIRQSILDAINRRNGISCEEMPEEYDKDYSMANDDIQPMGYSGDDFDVEENTNEEFKLAEERDAISVLMRYLNDREKYVISEYFGLKNGKNRTLEDIGNELGLTKERIRQINNTAFKKMRSAALTLGIDSTIY